MSEGESARPDKPIYGETDGGRSDVDRCGGLLNGSISFVNPTRFSPIRRLLAPILALAVLLSQSGAAVVINEFMAAGSDRLLQFPATGPARIGTGTPWYQASFDDASWSSAVGPFGYGTVTGVSTAIATNLETAMRYLTPTLYLRKAFTVSGTNQARPDAVQLAIEYNDGFVAYLNGVEIVRRNGGPASKFIYHDQPAYNREVFSATAPIPTTAQTETINLAAASSILLSGNNVLAIQALNAGVTDATFYVKASLSISGTPSVALVNFSDSWKYLPGVVEPSGGFYDPTLLGSGRQNVPWGTVAFDDGTWATGPGPIGAGSPGITLGTNLGNQVINVTPSVYTRAVFTVSAAEAAETVPLQLIVQYDDGFVAYVNGVEVARRKMGLPNTFTSHDAVADSETAATTTETINIDAPSKLLVTGNNVLAVQVHNYAINNIDLAIKATLKTTGASNRLVVPATQTWRYLIGTTEPIPPATEEEDASTPDGPDSVVDWIELFNNGATDVSLNSWTITDDVAKPAKWVFPNVTIPAGGYLVVIADDLDLKVNPGGYLHTNFKLGANGEYLGLYDAGGNVQSQIAPAFPPQSPFYSYGRDVGGVWRYYDTATPGAANAGTPLDNIVANPTVSSPGRFYTNSVTLTASCLTSGATIRYTTDGSDPISSSPALIGPITFSSNTPFRLRAFLANYVPSDIVTHTYLINQSVARRGLPAVCLTGDQTRVFYRPFGIFAINPNTTNAYTASIWSQFIGNTSGNLTTPNVPPDPTAYNAPMQSGQPAERPVGFEILHDNTIADLRTVAGLRTAGSPYSRPRYIFTNQNSASPNSASPWTATSTVEKPQLNLFFRDELGTKPLAYPLVPGSVVSKYENIRLRSGKNDISNPFIRDEFCRRLLIDLGQVVVRGDFVNVYVDAVFKGFFNITERPREAYFQEARRSDLHFDVRYITAMTDGDVLNYNELINYARTHNSMANYPDYLGMTQRLDVVNFCDYLLMNSYTAMWDWPGNNYVIDRERSSAGIWRFSVWDAEGGFGMGGHTNTYNSFTSDLISTNVAGETIPAKLFYTVLKQSPEFRLVFADRIQRAFFNNGALTDARIYSRFAELKANMEPMLKDVLGSGTVMTDVTAGWVPTRRATMFSQFTAEGLWPATLAPVFSQNGGAVPQNYQLTISNPNGAGTIYYTTNGRDPRAPNGGVQGFLYEDFVIINQPLVVKSRILNTNGEWSPLMEASFSLPTPPPLIFSEIMYRAPTVGGVDGDEFEFIELKNTGANTIILAGMRFTVGIDFTFPANATIAPGGFAVVVKNTTQFASKYPGVAIAGQYGPGSNLSNSGETVTLSDATGASVYSMTYDKLDPWPSGTSIHSPDGAGYSLVPIDPNGAPLPNSGDLWRGSTALGGSPGANDPAPSIPAITISEVLAASVAPQKDAIEIYNPTAQSVDIGSWWLSNSASVPKKFRIPPNTFLPPGGFVVFDETNFNPTPGQGASFSLNGNGDTLVLNSGENSGHLSGYTVTVPIPAALPGFSVGPVPGTGGLVKWTQLASQTFGGINAGPLIGPVVITEIMYNPAAGGDEFLELRNISSSPVPLFDPANPANGWQVVGLEFGFPTGASSLTLQSGQMALLVRIAPSSFRTKYNIPAAVPIYQYASPSNLGKDGELLSIQRPASPVAGQPLAYIDVDTVTYGDASPWPTSPDGFGPSLERINWRGYANDSANWRTSASGGTPAILTPQPLSQWRSNYFTTAELADPAISGGDADPDLDGITNFWEFAHGLDPRVANPASPMTINFANDAGNGPYLTITYRRNLGAQNFQLQVDTAADIGAWNLNSAVQIGLPINNGDGTETVTQRDAVAPGAAPQRFIRLRGTAN